MSMKRIKLLSVFCFLSIFSFSQFIEWEQVIHDDSGRSLFTGGMSFSNPTFADIDNDGDYDCFIGCDKGSIIHYENIGTANSAIWNFVTNKFNNINIPEISRSNVTFVDIDADGDLDMFFGGGRNSDETGIFYYRNDGNAFAPDWVFVSNKYMNIETNPTSIYNYCKTTFADMDNDGDLDLLFGNYRKDIYYENIGDAQNPDFILGDSDYFDFGSGYWNFHNPTFFDIDNDDDFDCFVGTTNSHFMFFENTGTPGVAIWNLVTEHFLEFDYNQNVAPSFCDIDGDQDFDMFVGLTNGKIMSYENQSSNWIFLGDNHFTMDIGFNSNITIADIYGNSQPSLFIVETGLDLMNNFITEFKNTGTSQEPFWQVETSSFCNIHYPDDWINSLCFADTDNDMDLDLCIGLGFGNKIMIHKNIGDANNPHFDSAGVIALEFNPASNIMFNPVLVDIDNDNDFDMYISAQETVMGYDPMIWYYENEGTPEQSDWQFDYSQPAQWGKIAFMDEDGDGDLDAFFSGYTDLLQLHDSLYLYENTGDIYNPDFSLTNTNYLPIDIDMFSALTFYDTDFDNDIDLYLGGDNGGIFYFENKGLIQKTNDPINTADKNNLLNCYPNPFIFSSGITIDFTIPETSDVEISIINSKGQIIYLLSQKNKQTGDYSMKWYNKKQTGFNLPGVYYCRLILGKRSILKKIIQF